MCYNRTAACENFDLRILTPYNAWRIHSTIFLYVGSIKKKCNVMVNSLSKCFQFRSPDFMKKVSGDIKIFMSTLSRNYKLVTSTSIQSPYYFFRILTVINELHSVFTFW